MACSFFFYYDDGIPGMPNPLKYTIIPLQIQACKTLNNTKKK